MKLRLVHILILTLFLFQNAWAMEQTYLVFCDSHEIAQEVEPHSHDEQSPAEHKHGTTHHCGHLSGSIVGITPSSIKNEVHSGHHYNVFVTNKLHSITNEPTQRPPIV